MLDSVRYSLANLESSPESELDVILTQLCALETQIDRELLGKVDKSVPKDLKQEDTKMTTTDLTLTPTDNSVNGQTMTDSSYNNRSHRRSGSGGGSSAEMQYTNGSRTDSPDNDSAYSDSLSLLSSEQSSSSGGASIGASLSNSSHILSKSNSNQPKDVQLFIKVFTADNSAKSLLADERMTVSIICRQLAEKNHIVMDPKCSIVEHIPELYLERFYEDNESLVENVLLWTRDSSNRLYFMEKEEKYDLFVNPEKYLLGGSSSERDAQLDDEAKATLIEEFFTVGDVGVPEVEGNLYLKSDGKKAWKKHFFVLRASGLYYCPKGKSKSSKDLVCLTTFEMNNVYYGFGWRKKYKAPNDFGFAIKHPQIQAKSSKYIKYLCAEDDNELKLWTTGIRIAKYGRQMKDNYENIMRDIVEADLDSLANRRSFSVCSMAKTIQVSPTSPTNSSPVRDNNSCDDGLIMTLRQPLVNNNSNNNSNWHRMSRQDSIRSSSTSSSSGCLSERGSNVSTPTMEQLAFEVDFPVGTIKRKPSAMQPKIPLTSTTRNLALQSDDALVEVDSSSSEEEMGIQRNCGTLKSGTLRRSATDERLKTRIYEPLQQRFQNINNNSAKLNDLPPPLRSESKFDDTIVDELPLPPPPQVLTTSLSTLSLNSLPPPPSEVLDSPDLSSNSTTPKASPVVSPKKSPQKSPQSPQVPPKPKLFRRLSESANDRNTFMSEIKRGANTLHKGSHHRNKLTMDLNSISCYATSPRMKCGPFISALKNCTSPTRESGSKTPTNEVMPSTHLRSPNHLQNSNHQMLSPTQHYCQQTNLYQNIQQTRQTQVLDQYQAQYQNNNNNNINSLHIQQYNSNNVNNNLGQQTQPQPYYPHSQHHQNYSNPSLPMQSLPHQYYQQPIQQMAPQFQSAQQQVSHYHQQQQRPQQLPIQPMQQYSNQQPIYQSNLSSPHQPQANHLMNGQTYTKSKIAYQPQPDPSSRSPMKGPLPTPPETFLREIQRVMEKKWKVAQTLSTDMSATPNQILGFRDQAYLPPNTTAHNSVNNMYDVLPSRPLKSVRISSTVNEIPNVKHSRRVPPPPPKRSDKTHLSQRQV